MRRQPPITRCFVALCMASGVALAALEWRNPFPDPVVTLEFAPEMAEGLLAEGESESLATAQQPELKRGLLQRRWPFSRLSAKAQPEVTEEKSVELVLSLDARSLEVRVPGEPPAVYDVAVGQTAWQTPTGDFTVLNKLENPAWQHPITKEEIPPGPDNPLGTHWIGFWTDGRAQIGFHGTNQEELIGEAVSHGCVRMRNEDIAELYKLVDVGTTVEVRP